MYAFTTNADSSEKLLPFIIGKATSLMHSKRRLVNSLGSIITTTPKLGWWQNFTRRGSVLGMTGFESKAGTYILLFQDNFKGHVPPDNLTNISVENFEPNLTPHVQPADGGIICCFKAHYCYHYIQRAINCYGSTCESWNPWTLYQRSNQRWLGTKDLNI